MGRGAFKGRLRKARSHRATAAGVSPGSAGLAPPRGSRGGAAMCACRAADCGMGSLPHMPSMKEESICSSPTLKRSL